MAAAAAGLGYSRFHGWLPVVAAQLNSNSAGCLVVSGQQLHAALCQQSPTAGGLSFQGSATQWTQRLLDFPCCGGCAPTWCACALSLTTTCSVEGVVLMWGGVAGRACDPHGITWEACMAHPHQRLAAPVLWPLHTAAQRLIYFQHCCVGGACWLLGAG